MTTTTTTTILLLDVEPFLSWTTTEETNDIEEFGEVPVEPKGTADALDLFCSIPF